MGKRYTIQTRGWAGKRPSGRDRRKARFFNRRGNASLDYVLVLSIILPLLLFLFTIVPRMIQLVYDMTIVIVGSPLI